MGEVGLVDDGFGRESATERLTRFAASVYYEKGKRQAVVSVMSAFSRSDEITFHAAFTA
jgi:hypothetical protein